MCRVQLYLLGAPRLQREGQVIYIDTQKAIALLAYLAVNGGVSPRAELMALLWPELTRNKAQNALRRTLSTLRNVIGRECLDTTRFTVSLTPFADGRLSSLDGAEAPPTGGLWIDAVVFRRLLAQNTPEALAEALLLYQGDFLSGFSLRDSLPFDEWQAEQARRLRYEATKACETLTRIHTERQAWAAAIQYAQRWLELDPLYEPAHRHLMILYVQSGARPTALHQYQYCEELLQNELGINPAEETSKLHQEIRENRLDLPNSHIERQNEVELYEAIGDLQMLLGEYEAAIRHFETAVTSSSQTVLLPKLLHKLGNVYSRQGRWDLAKQQLMKALHAATNIGSIEMRGRVLVNLSWVYFHQRETVRARDLAQESLSLAGQTNDAQTLAQAHNILGFLNGHENQHDQALHHLEKALQAAQLQVNKSILAAVLNNLALVHGMCGNLSQALALAEKGLTIGTAHGDRHCKAALHNNLADLLYKAGNPKTATFHVKQAVAVYAEIGMTDEDVQLPIWDFRVW